MKLQSVDKQRYHRHLRLTFAAIAVALAVLSIAISMVLIKLFSTPDEPHFWFNLGGVIVAAVIVVFSLSKSRRHPFLAEVAYVWDLKQVLNKIYRKQRKIEQLADQGEVEAMQILNFQYHGSRQLYELDDNTITIDDLMLKLRRLEKQMKEVGLDPSTEDFDLQWLDKY